jgi:hypothetical protein
MSFIQSISLIILKDRLNYRGLESGRAMKLRDIAAALSVSEAKPPKSGKRITVLVATEGMKALRLCPSLRSSWTRYLSKRKLWLKHELSKKRHYNILN